MVHPLHDLLLTVQHLVRTLLEDVALEVVLVVGFPRLRTHVAEVFGASAGHEVAAHWPLNCLFAPRAHLGIASNPLGIRLLSEHLLQPLLLLLALARVVVIALASEAKHLPTHTLDRIDSQLVYLDAVHTVSPSTKLVVSVGCYE